MTNHLRPNGQRAKNAILLIWIVLTLEVVSLISGYFQLNLLTAVAEGAEITMEAADANDSREQIIAIIYMLVYVISAVMFIQWFRRAYFNLQQRVHSLSYSDGWAAGAWFVPIISLFRPFQMMKELFDETKRLLTKNELSTGINLSTTILGWWWGVWVLNNVLGQSIIRYSLHAETIDELINMTVAGMVNNIAGIPLAMLAIKLIKNYSEAEPILYQLVEQEHKEAHEQAAQNELATQ